MAEANLFIRPLEEIYEAAGVNLRLSAINVLTLLAKDKEGVKSLKVLVDHLREEDPEFGNIPDRYLDRVYEEHGKKKLTEFVNAYEKVFIQPNAGEEVDGPDARPIDKFTHADITPENFRKVLRMWIKSSMK